MIIEKGQTWQVNTFYLGFVNIYPTDIIVEVVEVDYTHNVLTLSPKPMPGFTRTAPYASIEKWFQTIYPSLEKTSTILKQPEKFELLVRSYGLKVADIPCPNLSSYQQLTDR